MIRVPVDVLVDELSLRVGDKLRRNESDIKIRYKDQDGDLCLMMDQEYLVYALECAGVDWGETLEVFVE
jgi:hypothetical protein